jgi:hypothetical protein
MKTRSVHLLSLACFVGCFGGAFSAQAQQVGTYTGTAQDGSAVIITVGTDPNNGKFEVTGASFDAGPFCQKSLETMGGFGFGFPDGHDIENGEFAFNYADAEEYSNFNLKFHGTQSVKGKLNATFAAFNPFATVGSPPQKLQFCNVKTEPFSATFSGAAARTTLAPGTMSIRRANSQIVISVPARKN